MTNQDLVRRLRESATFALMSAARETVLAAADEIERLRAISEPRPAAWAVICGDCVDSTFTDRDEAVEWACGLIPPPQIVPLYRSPTLTDAERDAVAAAIGWIESPGMEDEAMPEDYLPITATLRGLLERMK